LGAGRATRLALMESQRTNELAAVVIDDMALAFELLRQVNSAQARSARGGSGGPVLTVRRAIAMLGMEGLRRATLALRPWPGALAEAHAEDLSRLMARVRRAACVAVALRPAGFDPEVVALLTMMQSLGRLLAAYHCADEWQQIRRLMLPAPAERPGEPPQPGMTEEAAAFSVIGVDLESIGLAVGQRCGLDEDILAVLRRWPLQSLPHAPEGDAEQLRLVASCANEMVDTLLLPPAQQATGLARIVQRYGRVLHLQLKDLQTTIQESATAELGKLLTEGSGNSMFSMDAGMGAEDSPFR
jgi:eukaryotic-like serine/threonine-protein kinase